MKTFGAVLVIAVWTLPVNAQNTTTVEQPDINTDRPDVTESAVVIPRASLQIENGTTRTLDHGNHSVDFSETLIRLGILSGTELRLDVPNYLNEIAGAGLRSGFGDLSLGIKQQLGPLPGGVDLAVIIAVSFPTGQSGVTSGGYDPFIKFPWSKELKSGWSVGGQQSLFWNTVDGRRNGTWEPTQYLEKQIAKPVDAFVEYAGDYLWRGASRQLLHFGAAYKITPLHQIDFHFGFGLNAATPNHFFAVGYSFRLDHLWK
jgi:hypothetical protein